MEQNQTTSQSNAQLKPQVVIMFDLGSYSC